jgi:hypothetical protein
MDRSCSVFPMSGGRAVPAQGWAGGGAPAGSMATPDRHRNPARVRTGIAAPDVTRCHGAVRSDAI